MMEVFKENHSDRMLKEVEAAALLGLSRATLACWRSRGVGPRYLKFSRAVRYRESDLRAYIESATKNTYNSGEAPRG